MVPDVCLIVEGTYPYVSGGVSAWIHALLSNLPDFSFSLLHLSATPGGARTPKYQLPPNVVALQDVFLHDVRWAQPARGARRRPPADWQRLKAFHEALAARQPYDSAGLLRQLDPLQAPGQGCADLVYAAESWRLLEELYSTRAPSTSLVDYFWTFRATHLPLFTLLQVPLPRTRLYHSPSTGFGGFLGGLANLRSGAPLLITEHGIYNREREIEIAQAEWIKTEAHEGHHLTPKKGVLQQWWIELFRFLTQFAYERAERIISITGANQQYQRYYGAPSEKMMLISNGIDLERFGSIERTRTGGEEELVVGFVGRVVSIKDVKTFLRAIKAASQVIPRLVAYVVGPQDEEPEYFAECQRLTEWLGLTSVVQFTGPADVRDYYGRIDVLVLTSVSEAQPLVILEANCAGVPVVATDVGACRELLTGVTAEDQALGPSGLLTRVASPGETAEALIRLWREPGLRQRMAESGQERVRRFYRQEDMYAAYRILYRRYLQTSPVGA